MDLETLGNLGDFVGGITVVITIIYLAYQTRQNRSAVDQSNRIAKAMAEHSIASGYIPLNILLADNEQLLQNWVKAKSADAQLDEIESLRLQQHILGLVNQWQSMEVAYHNGLISGDRYKSVIDDQRMIIETYPGCRPIVQQIVDTWGSVQDRETMRSLVELINSAK